MLRDLMLLGALSTLVGCVPKPVEGTSSYAARTVVDVTPHGQPAIVGTYDFDLIGESKGTACAEWGQRGAGGFYEVLVDGHPAVYSASIAGATFESDDPRIKQAESAAVFNALSKLEGADLMFVTRSVVQAETPDRVCATVWGQSVRLKKGPTLVPASPPSPAEVQVSVAAPHTAAPPPPPPPALSPPLTP